MATVAPPATVQLGAVLHESAVPEEDVMVPSGEGPLQPGVGEGPAWAALEKPRANPAETANEPMNMVAFVRAQTPTDTSTPLILVSR
jgi:hypothetical protein